MIIKPRGLQVTGRLSCGTVVVEAAMDYAAGLPESTSEAEQLREDLIEFSQQI